VTLDELLERKRTDQLPPPEQRRALRHLHELTESDIGTIVGAATSSVSRWETGKREPRGDQRRRYRELLEQLARTIG
jgi:DNA-binding transcriptional regulator YiaG